MGAPASLPLLSRASRPLTFEITAVNEKGESLPISIAGEHPLTLYVDKREIVTLMTLGAWPEALAIGYLRNQRQPAAFPLPAVSFAEGRRTESDHRRQCHPECEKLAHRCVP